MTPLGLYLFRKSINKAEVARKTGLSPSRLSELTLNANAHLRVAELNLIAKAIDVDACDLLKAISEEKK